MRKQSDKYDEAIALRKQGLSYPEISRKLDVSKSTLSIWLRSLPVVLGRERLMPSEVFRTQGQRLHAKRLGQIASMTNQACQEVGALSLRELKMLGAMLYWAEGTKDPKTEPVTISNSDPALVRFALRWLREVCRVPDRKIH